MRVKAGYYNEQDYHRPEVVERYTKWAACIARSDSFDDFTQRVAHQIKCLVIKRYRRGRYPDFIPLCPEWEKDPDAFHEFLMERKRIDPRRLDIERGSTEYSPRTII